MHRGLPLGLLLLLAATGRSADFALTLPAKGAAPGADLVYNKEFMSGILRELYLYNLLKWELFIVLCPRRVSEQ